LSSQAKLETLFIRFLNNECSGEEVEWLMQAFDAGENEDLLRSLVLHQLESSSVPGDNSAAVDQVYARLSEHIRESASPGRTGGTIRMYRLLKNLAVAASILALLGAGYWMFYARRLEKKPLVPDSEKTIAVKDFAPGGDKAVLTLANGSSILLDSAHNGTLTRQGDTRVLKLANGQLAYRAPTAEQSATLYNTVATPKGGQYQVTLSDGTRVWLNAASSLRFPTAFAGAERKVEVTGEVYFEVAHNTMPFIVKKGDMEVRVLGTHFNINAYEDETDMKVTLLEGKVNITQRKDQQLLSPGQQARIKTGEAIAVNSTVNLETVMAWKNGLFDFNSADIKTIMRQISRWYNIEVAYEGNIPDRQFSGKISRNTNASNVLKILELSNIHFKMEHERIVVMP